MIPLFARISPPGHPSGGSAPHPGDTSDRPRDRARLRDRRAGRGARRRTRPGLLAAGTAIAVLVGVAAPVSARAVTAGGWSAAGLLTIVLPENRTPAGENTDPPGSAAFRAGVRALQPYVHRTARGTFTIDAPSSVVARIPAAAYAQIRRSSNLVNRDIIAGRLLSLPGGRVVLPTTVHPGATTLARSASPPAGPAGEGSRSPRPAPEPSPAAGSDPAVSTAAATGNSITVEWWGVVIHLDHATSTQLIAVLAGAATVTDILALLVSAGVISSVAAVPLAILGGVLTLVTGALRTCLTDRGMDLSITWLVVGWCTPAT